MFKLGNNRIGKVMFGGNVIGKAYFGGELVYQNGSPSPPPPPLKNYFWSEAIEDGTFTLTIPSSVTLAMLEYVSYSVDNGVTWVTTNNVASTEVTITTPAVTAGSKVFWRGKGKAYASSNTEGTYSKFSCSDDFNVGGDIGYLFYDENYSGTFNAFTANYALLGFFRDSTVIDASELILSSKACSTYQQCYRSLFYNCTKLTTPPIVLLKDATGSNCCYYMFGYCSSLESIAEFELTASSRNNFDYIYRGCSSLTSADLSEYGWTGIPKYAFYDCESLVSVTMPSSVTDIDSYAFAGASASTAPKISTLNLSLNTSLTRIRSYAFNYCPITSVTFPNSLERLDMYSFSNTSLTSIQFPNSLTRLEGYAFMNCTGLRGATIDLSGCSNLTYLGMAGCQAASISIPSSVTTLEDPDAFRSTRFSAIDLSSCTSLTTIPLRCFYQNGSYTELIKLPSSITQVKGNNFTAKTGATIVCYATTPPTCDSALTGATNWNLYVPYSANHSVIAAYQQDQYWGEVTHLYELNQDGTIPA